MNARILTVNGGSSSIKFALFETTGGLRCAVEGKVDRIGLPGTTFAVKNGQSTGNSTRSLSAPDFAAAAASIVEWLETQTPALPAAIAHRVVHGGPSYSTSARITRPMIETLRQLCPFDPQHLPAQLMLIETLGRHYSDRTQIACFDTAFHRDMPRVAQLLPIPRRYEALGMRRYGFHGLSYAFLMQELARVAGGEAANGRVILAHLGNGASLAAVHDGKSMDTSMGFTPAAGIPMSTRSGDLDPGLAGYLAHSEGMDAGRFSEMVNFKSGLLGVSETSSDMRDLLASEAHDVRAAEAVALFCYQAKKCIGSYAAALGGLDTLVFAGGMGESAPVVRARICAGLAFLGVELDEERNAVGAAVISRQHARVTVRVLHTDEERMMALSVCQLLDIPL